MLTPGMNDNHVKVKDTHTHTRSLSLCGHQLGVLISQGNVKEKHLRGWKTRVSFIQRLKWRTFEEDISSRTG